jgi:hypothetical protein
MIKLLFVLIFLLISTGNSYPDMTITAMGFNVLATKYTEEGFNGYYKIGEWPWAERLVIIENIIVDLYDADLISMSEFGYDIHDDIEREFPDYIATGPEIPRTDAPSGSPVGFKCWVLYKKDRFEKHEHASVNLPGAKNAEIIHFTEKSSGRDIIFAAAHMYRDESMDQLDDIWVEVEKLQEAYPDAVTMYAGDFNMKENESSSEFLREKLQDTYMALHGSDNDRIDFVYATQEPDGVVLEAELNKDALEGSDHPAAMAKILFPGTDTVTSIAPSALIPSEAASHIGLNTGTNQNTSNYRQIYSLSGRKIHVPALYRGRYVWFKK